MLEVENATFGHRGQPVTVRDASLQCRSGEIISILGTNGSGKSEVVQGIAGFIPLRSGDVKVDGNSIGGQPAFRIAQKGISLVPAGRRIFPELTVIENLRVPLRHDDEEAISEMFDRFPILAQRRDQHAGALSGGEQQQLAIARALATKPSVLLLDEPSAGLSPVMTEKVYAQLDEIRGKMMIVLVEQIAKLVLPLADRIYVMRGGSVVAECEPEDLRDEDTVKALYFGQEI